MTGIRKEEIVEDKKELLCRIAGLLFQKGLVSGKDGNISIKTGEDEMLITPSGICKGFLTPDMIIRQRFDGTIIEGSLKSTREAGMHSRLYELRPDIGAVVHTHPPAGSAELVAEVEKVADSDVIFLQNHGVITYGPDIYEAFSRMDAVENTAKTILYSQSLGDVREF